MSVFAEFTLPAAAVPLGRALEAVPSSRIELERIVPVGETVLPFFWITGSDDIVDAFSAAAGEEPAIEALTVVDTIGDRTLFRAEWAEEVDGVITGIETTGATVLEATGSANEWQFELRFTDHSSIRGFQRYCTEQNIEINLTRVRHIVDPDPTESDGLTDVQRETLLLAYERGYFREPREVTLEDLADEFDVTERAVSRRIGRGIERLLASTIAAEDVSALEG